MAVGAEISHRFFERAVRPIVEDVMSGRGYLAGRLGSGSDALGFDDAMSTDHDFGCRLTVLVDDQHLSLLADLDEALSDRLPDEVDGWPVRFPTSWDGRTTHRVDLHTCYDFATTRLGFDLRSRLGVSQWLCLTGQSVLEVTAGPVFHDTTDAFGVIRRTLTWYPDNIWYYGLAAGWTRLGQELPFVGRTGQIGDEAGSRMIASRLCRDIAHLTFLVNRAWAPYPKWTGTALGRLPRGRETAERLNSIQAASNWSERHRRLANTIENLADQHRLAGLDLPAQVLAPFFDRPFLGIEDQVSQSLRKQIDDPTVRNLPLIGSIEQWSDNVDLLSLPERRALATTVYASTGTPSYS